MLSSTMKINDLSMIFKGKRTGPAQPGRFGARLLPQQPHTNEELTVEVVGKVPEEAPSQARCTVERRCFRRVQLGRSDN